MRQLQQQHQQSTKTISQDLNNQYLVKRQQRKRHTSVKLQNKQQQLKKIRRKRLYSDKKRSSTYKHKLPLSEQFTLQEDQLILQSVLKMGPKFKVISSYFPLKSLSTVKNRYYKYLRYRWSSILGKDYDSLQKENSQEIVETAELCPEIRDIVKNMINNIKSLTSQ